MSLFGWDNNNEEDWTLQQKMDAQVDLLGVSLEAHPLELVAEKIAASGAISTVDVAGKVGRRVTVAGVRQTSHRSWMAKGEAMLFLTLEDLSGMLDVIAFPDVYRTAKDLLNSTSPILVTGMMEMDISRGEPYLRVEKVMKFV